MKVLKEEEPTTSHAHTIWFAPDEGEDWGTLRSDIGARTDFKPNRLCVIVYESSGQVNAGWSQAREVRTYGDPENPEEIVGGLWGPEDRHQIPERCRWWWDALYDAEQMVRTKVRAAKAAG